jgi:hypothetical protein
VQALLDSALDPVLDRVEAEADDPAEALLSVTVIDPRPPAVDTLRQIELQGDILISNLMTLQSYIFDFLSEMQTLLVGQMFDHAIPPRVPIDSSSVVVCLDRYAELSTYFRQETNWGRNPAAIESGLRAGRAGG